MSWGNQTERGRPQSSKKQSEAKEQNSSESEPQSEERQNKPEKKRKEVKRKDTEREEKRKGKLSLCPAFCFLSFFCHPSLSSPRSFFALFCRLPLSVSLFLPSLERRCFLTLCPFFSSSLSVLFLSSSAVVDLWRSYPHLASALFLFLSLSSFAFYPSFSLFFFAS